MVQKSGGIRINQPTTTRQEQEQQEKKKEQEKEKEKNHKRYIKTDRSQGIRPGHMGINLNRTQRKHREVI